MPQCAIHFKFPKKNLVSHISESIQWMSSADNFTTDISKWLHISNVTEAYQNTNRVNYMPQMLTYNDRCTSFDYMGETLSYLAFQGWYDIDCAEVLNQLSAANEKWNTCSAHPLHLQHCQAESFFFHVSHQLNQLRQSLVCGACGCIKVTFAQRCIKTFRNCEFWMLSSFTHWRQLWAWS